MKTSVRSVSPVGIFPDVTLAGVLPDVCSACKEAAASIRLGEAAGPRRGCHTVLTAWFSGEAHWGSLLERGDCF